ncbi:arabinan endo-1,5-alpha-L-arabinosidase [Haloferula sp. BvORR071]|uniref:arabinan endo-1,5-alpha-L-arabinosidase n=1 Tax=Haloferula sp. BvORR071 TaxID=1396141 RepID=UPI00054E3EE6|nr:arabinan endo-1,5-alpha-L-arabinosidase [Haloferula sp. BvORR071]
MSRIASTLLAACSLNAVALADGPDKSAPGGPLEATASRGVTARDPSTIVRDGDTFWCFYTGRGTPSLKSKDLVTWERGQRVFDKAPEWIAKVVPKNDGVYWAPDLLKVGDQWFLYYSVSSFGAMHSAIGLATNPTLNSDDPAFKWTDQGVVVESQDGGDFNTIDPAIFHDDDGKLWLAFGSQWSGLKLVELDPKTGKRLKPDEPMTPIAAGQSIEAPWIYKRKGFYYLFLNRGNCCAGDKSTYHIKVGRSESIKGPYIAKDEALMIDGGGTMVLDMKIGPLTGPGHAGIVEKDGKSWFSCHFEADDRMGGKATLGVMAIQWSEDGWPDVQPPDKAK